MRCWHLSCQLTFRRSVSYQDVLYISDLSSQLKKTRHLSAERKCCLISTSYLVELFDFFILLQIMSHLRELGVF